MYDRPVLLVFDNDGVLRDESVSYERCIIETVNAFSDSPANETELVESMKVSNNDWERAHNIVQERGVEVSFDNIKNHFQSLYLGTNLDYSGYINDEPWLVNNDLLNNLSKKFPLAIVSGAPREEIEYTLNKNNASKFFSKILGMEDCKGKKDGLEKVAKHFDPSYIMFCDDRPSPIKEAKNVDSVVVESYGIIPPQNFPNWERVLKKAGALETFQNVNNYCNFIIKNKSDLNYHCKCYLRD